MTTRIRRSSEGETTTIRIEGRLDAGTVPDLRGECRSCGRLQVDLSGLLSADAEGIGVLRSLAADGAELRGASPYVRLLLHEGTANEPEGVIP